MMFVPVIVLVIFMFSCSLAVTPNNPTTKKHAEQMLSCPGPGQDTGGLLAPGAIDMPTFCFLLYSLLLEGQFL